MYFEQFFRDDLGCSSYLIASRDSYGVSRKA